MPDDNIRRLFDAMDILRQQGARVETLLQEKEKMCDVKFRQIEKLEERVSLLEKSRSFFSGGFGFLAWAISTVIMLFGVLQK